MRIPRRSCTPCTKSYRAPYRPFRGPHWSPHVPTSAHKSSRCLAGPIYSNPPPASPDNGGAACTCPASWLGDGVCDQYDSTNCNVAECGYDNGDCAPKPPTPPSPPPSACPCPISWLGDGECDASLGCNIADCTYDGGDCVARPPSSPTLTGCSCPIEWIADGYCDVWGTWDCNTLACNFDGGDCAAAPPSTVRAPPSANVLPGCDCPPAFLGDGVCDNIYLSFSCNSAACGNDGGDCAPSAPPTPRPPSVAAPPAPPQCECAITKLTNGVCDPECNTALCEYDKGDCTRLPSPPAAPGSVCHDGLNGECVWYASDGDCDDGGPGSEFAFCPFGTDCADCGPRLLPPIPSPPPSPSPYPPGAVCTDEASCPFLADGQCDDGGSASTYSACTLGTDCSDCGARFMSPPPLPPPPTPPGTRFLCTNDRPNCPYVSDGDCTALSSSNPELVQPACRTCYVLAIGLTALYLKLCALSGRRRRRPGCRVLCVPAGLRLCRLWQAQFARDVLATAAITFPRQPSAGRRRHRAGVHKRRHTVRPCTQQLV